jgi:hypothetical protein
MLILMGLVLMLCWFFHVVADCFSPLCTRCRSGLSSCVEFMAAQMQGTRREICWCASMCGLLPNGAFNIPKSWQDPTSVQGCSWLLMPWWPPDFLWAQIRGNGECTNSISRVPECRRFPPDLDFAGCYLDLRTGFRQEVLFGLLGSWRQWLKRKVCFVNVKSAQKFALIFLSCHAYLAYLSSLMRWVGCLSPKLTDLTATTRSMSCPVDAIDMEHDRYLL